MYSLYKTPNKHICSVLFCSPEGDGGGGGGGRGWRLTCKRTEKKKPKEVLIRNDTFTDTP